MFLDKVKITIKAGNGGKGVVSFYRSKMTMNGGPDGGDGGSGGNIIFRASHSIIFTILAFVYLPTSFRGGEMEKQSNTIK